MTRIWNFLTFIFRVTKHTKQKYALISLRLKAAEISLLLPNRWHELQWNLLENFVNTNVGVGKNISLDFRMEHVNKVTKQLTKCQGTQNITDENVETVSKSVNITGKWLEVY